MVVPAAESSITIPDCDDVICLGSAKRIEYNALKRRVQLVHRWISQASAVQVCMPYGENHVGASLYCCYCLLSYFLDCSVRVGPLE